MTDLTSIARAEIMATKTHFDSSDSNLNFNQEACFALQQMKANDYLGKIAMARPSSIKEAMLNLASIGLSLNPADKHAYLIPRGGEVCLDISYTGLVSLATKSGAIEFVTAEIVYQGEDFQLGTHNQAPLHAFDPFNRNSDMRGVYCVAQLNSGGVMVETMTKTEIDDIRSLSHCSSSKSSPWVNFYGEMAKKCVIKRASKLWPSPTTGLSNAIQYLNTSGAEGIASKSNQEKIINEVNDDQPNVCPLSDKQIMTLVKKAKANPDQDALQRASDWFKEKLEHHSNELEFALKALSL